MRSFSLFIRLDADALGHVPGPRFCFRDFRGDPQQSPWAELLPKLLPRAVFSFCESPPTNFPASIPLQNHASRDFTARFAESLRPPANA
jgi:hypothetical protein